MTSSSSCCRPTLHHARILLCMCPHATICVPYFYNMCRHATMCRHICTPQSPICVCRLYYVCVRMLLYMCPHANIDVCSCNFICVLIYASRSALYMCVLMLLYMRPHSHATIDVCSCDYISVLIYASRRACRRHDPHTAYCPSTSHELIICVICKAQSPSTSRSWKAGCRTAYRPSASHGRGGVTSRCLPNACNKCNKTSWPHCRRR